MPQIIVVLGMHRSGTSALAGLLAQAGVECGQPLLPANDGNPRGYWELAPLVEVNDRILEVIKRRWLDASPLPGGWSTREDVRELDSAADTMLRAQFGGSPLGMFKDPRLCLTLPFWRRALQRLDWPLSLVVIGRPLSEVVQSIQARDPIGGRDVAYLWARSMLEALRACFYDRHLIFTYDQLLESPAKVLARISGEFAANLAEGSAERFVDPRLRHHVRPPSEDIPEVLERFCDDLYAVIKDVSRLDVPIGAALFRSTEAAMDLLDRNVLSEVQQEALWHAREERALALSGLDSARGNMQLLATEVVAARTTIDTLSREIADARQAHSDRDEIERQLRARLEVLEQGQVVNSHSNAP